GRGGAVSWARGSRGGPPRATTPHLLYPSRVPSNLGRILAAIVRARWVVIAVYAVLLPPAAWYAAHAAQDNSLDRLIVPSDPDFLRTRAFQEVFGAGEFALLLADADNPFAPAALQRIDD